MHSIIIGLIAIACGLWGLTVWWWSFVELMRGIIPVLAILFGLIALASGVSAARLDDKATDEDVLDEGK